MKPELFEEFLESVRDGGAILRGEKRPSRSFELSQPDVGAIRAELGLSQEQFARLLGVRVATIQNWEQGRRKPRGAAFLLLLVAAKHPEAVLDAVGA
ncbi:MAG: helix-turn-helix domain-containing protein [Verrucomicrobia bacterium]|nr:helix-turn-helix domain-containing protein [Verrucomicrobiota bacterium]